MILLWGYPCPLSRRYWDARQRVLLSTDKQACVFSLSVLAAVTVYNVNMYIRSESSGMLPAELASLFSQMALEVLQLLFVCRHKMYIKHRSSCIMAARVASLALMIHYVPKTWEFTISAELASGRHMAVAYRLIIGGCLTASCTIEALAFQLPISTAVPYHALRAIVSLTLLLPQLLQVFAANPPLRAIAESLWANISWLYGSAAMAATGTNAPINTSSAACPVLALMLFVHIVFALLVPLYCLGLHEGFTKQAFVRQLQANNDSGSESDSWTSTVGTSSGSSVQPARALGAQPEHPHQEAHTDMLNMSASDPHAAAAMERNYGISRSTTAQRRRSNSESGSSFSSSSTSFTARLDGFVGSSFLAATRPAGYVCVCKPGVCGHLLLMLCGSMLLWAVLDVGVTCWADQLTQYCGICV